MSCVINRKMSIDTVVNDAVDLVIGQNLLKATSRKQRAVED